MSEPQPPSRADLARFRAAWVSLGLSSSARAPGERLVSRGDKPPPMTAIASRIPGTRLRSPTRGCRKIGILVEPHLCGSRADVLGNGEMGALNA
jgi:hypothetical protein